jgi:hypothetical protein
MRLTGTNSETGESWVGTPLANLSGYLNLVQQSIGQLLVNGGTITLAGNEFIGARGSIINLMGGYVEYLGGMLNTTMLVGADGRIYNIGSANANMTYVGIAGQFTVDHNSGGKADPALTQIYGTGLFGPQYQADYIQGGNAGTLTIQLSNTNGASSNSSVAVANSGALILDSTLLAGTEAGVRQVASGALPSNAALVSPAFCRSRSAIPACCRANRRPPCRRRRVSVRRRRCWRPRAAPTRPPPSSTAKCSTAPTSARSR